MNGDGSGQARLTDNSAKDVAPTWSADGSKIAFQSDRDGNEEIYVMGADGSAQRNLTDSPGEDTRPTWSPDGSKIAFRSDRDGDWQIYVMNIDGSGLARLTDNSSRDTDPDVVARQRKDRVHVIAQRQRRNLRHERRRLDLDQPHEPLRRRLILRLVARVMDRPIRDQCARPSVRLTKQVHDVVEGAEGAGR